MLCGLQNRGLDATGIAMNNVKGEVVVFKGDKTAWQLTSSKEYAEFLKENLTPDTNMVLLHTRAATKGSPRENKNNHPMFHNKCAVVHNGIINNDDWLFGDLKMDRHAETDSDVLRAILDKENFTKKAIRTLAKVAGSVACAAISPEQPEHLLLVRSGSPLVVAACGDYLVWASEKKHIHAAMRPWIQKWGLSFQMAQPAGIAYLTMADNTAWIFGPKGLEWHDECKTTNYYREPQRMVWDQYKERNTRWDDEEKRKHSVLRPHTSNSCIRAKCPKCGKLNKIEPRLLNADIATLRCGQCKASLQSKK